MKNCLPLFTVLTALALSACAGGRTCNADADYREAAAIPPIQAAEGLSIPASPSALKVPPLSAEAAAAARQPMPKKGRGTACLDYPPEMPAQASEPPKS